MGFWPEAVAGLGTVYHPPEIFAVRLRDVLVWPRHNLLLTNKRAVVRDSTSTVLPITLRGWTERLFAPIRDMAGVCFLFRGVHNNFYHTMIDNMARLYCLHLPPYTELTEIKLLLPTAPTALESFIFERYPLDNVSVEVIGTECLVRPETLIFASFPTRRSLTYLPRSYLEHVMPKFLPKRTRARRNRIFIARRESNRVRRRQRCRPAWCWTVKSNLRGLDRPHRTVSGPDDDAALLLSRAELRSSLPLLARQPGSFRR